MLVAVYPYVSMLRNTEVVREGRDFFHPDSLLKQSSRNDELEKRLHAGSRVGQVLSSMRGFEGFRGVSRGFEEIRGDRRFEEIRGDSRRFEGIRGFSRVFDGYLMVFEGFQVF
jgi:hypothetical protein